MRLHLCIIFYDRTPEQQLIDYKGLLATHITPEFAAAVPIMEFMLEEGIKVLTNMYMNWYSHFSNLVGKRVHHL